MGWQFSLAHLTALQCSPPQLIEIAARAGYDFVGLRPIPVGARDEPLHPFATDRTLFTRTKSALAATGVQLLDIEVARIIKEAKPQDYLPAMEAAAQLGGKHVLSSAWCDDRSYIRDFFSELCGLAQQFGLTVGLEFVTWSGIRTLNEAAELVREARCDNSGIVVDTLHFDRCRADLATLGSLPRDWFQFVQISDAPAKYSTDKDELIRIGRSARLYLGEGGIDVAAILRRLPTVPLSVEIPNTAKLAARGAQQ
jgi:sugar phosphate isomerase/epimerase